MKFKILMLLLPVVLLLASSVNAYNIQLIPGGSTDVTGSSFFDVSIVFNPDAGGNALGTFGFNLFYDTNEMTYISYQLFLPSPIVPAFTAPFESPSGKLNNLSGNLPFGSTAPTISSAYTLATIRFFINNPGVNNPVADGQSDVWFDTASGTGLTIGGQFKQMSTITRIGAPNIFINPTPASYVKLTGASTSYHSSIQDAYDAASNMNTIQVLAVTTTEDLYVDLNKSVTLQGGYNSTFTSHSGKTTVHGNMVITDGVITIGDIILQ